MDVKESITIDKFEALIAESYQLDDQIERAKLDVMAPLNDRKKALEAEILAHLEANGMKSYKSRKGMITRTNRYSVRVPHDLNAKQEFFDWLHEKGEPVFWQYVTINSQSLNSLYREEMEIAKEEENYDFKIPGLGAPELHVTLSKRAK